MAINDVLLLLVRGTNLSVVPDPSISGSFIGDLKSVTVRQALGLILQPLGLDFTVDGGVIRVFRREPETRLFAVDYVAAERTGEASVGIDPAARANGSYARVTTSHQDRRVRRYREGHSGAAVRTAERSTSIARPGWCR